MKFLIDGSGARIKERRKQANELIAGQLLTPLTGYKKCEDVFGVDNGGFSGAKPKEFSRILKRQFEFKDQCLFAAIPDKVGNHKETVSMWEEYEQLADGYKKAFVVQDGFDEWPSNADAIFLGGSTEFKESYEAEQIVIAALDKGMHVHIGRVNTFYRFYKFHCMGAHTCDGSGISMYDHMLANLYALYKKRFIKEPDVTVQIDMGF
jgi:CRISPR/Cas system CMR-associated protein Cmr3 (group 5 of RAMP superfamily)